jgi:DNA-binding CsgD family transcriptional regulator/PAS domain-containing protein
LSLDEGVSRFIGSLYEAVYDAGAWRLAMHEMMRRTQSRLAFITCADIRHKELSRSEFYGAEDSRFLRAAEEYSAEMYRTDPSLQWASEHPNAGVCDTSKIMPPDDFRHLEYVRWQEALMGTVHWRVFYTQPVDDLSFAVSLHPPASDGPASKEQGKLHKLLFEHMERALRLAARPPDLGASSEAVIVLDTAGQVLAMSPKAERIISQGDGLTVIRRRILANSPTVTQRLNAAFASAIQSTSLGGAGGGVRLPRSNGNDDWLALVSPCPRFLEHLPVRTPAAIVRILETGLKAELSPAHADLFDLSPREGEVAAALLCGHSLESLCHALGISRNTAKAHLQSIFRKTGTNRQSELVHLLAEVARN